MSTIGMQFLWEMKFCCLHYHLCPWNHSISLGSQKSHTYDQEKMADIQLCNTHTLGSHGLKVARVHIHDWFILLLLVGIEVLLNAIDPFYRFVGKDMMTDLKYPFKKSTVPLWAVPVRILFHLVRYHIVVFVHKLTILVLWFGQVIAVVLPFIIFSVIYYKRRDVYDLHHAILGKSIFLQSLIW